MGPAQSYTFGHFPCLHGKQSALSHLLISGLAVTCFGRHDVNGCDISSDLEVVWGFVVLLLLLFLASGNIMRKTKHSLSDCWQFKLEHISRKMKQIPKLEPSLAKVHHEAEPYQLNFRPTAKH